MPSTITPTTVNASKPCNSAMKTYLIAITALLPAVLALVATSATTVCQPNIAGYFGATQYETNTVITCYVISGGLMLPVTSYFSQKFGEKTYFIYSFILFLIGCALCIFAPNLQLLIIARIIQGIGSGSLLPLCQSTLINTFPKEQRGIAMGLFGVAAMFAPLIGPLFGGYLTDNLSWKWVFIANIPLGLVSLLMMKLFLKEDDKNRPKFKKKFDIVGFTSICIAMGCMQIVLDKGQQFNWFDTDWICWLTGLGIFAFVVFYVRELECKNPLVEIRVFKNRNFLVGTFVSAFINVVIYSTLVLVPMFVQSLIGYSPSKSGLAMCPRALACLVGLLIMGKISQYVEERILAGLGFILMAIAVIYLSNLSQTASIESIVIPNVALCFFVSVAFVPITALAFKTLTPQQTNDAASLHALFKNILTAMATSVSATFIARVSQVHQNYLVGNLSFHNPVFRYEFSMLQAKFMHYYPAVVATKKANGVLYKNLLLQSKLASFYDAFLLLGLICLVMIPLIALLQSERLNER